MDVGEEEEEAAAAEATAAVAIDDVPVELATKRPRDRAREEITRFLHGGRSPATCGPLRESDRFISDIYLSVHVIVLDNGNAMRV